MILRNVNYLINLDELIIVDVCRGLSIFFLDDLSCRIFVTSIFCLLDVLSVDVLSVPKIIFLAWMRALTKKSSKLFSRVRRNYRR